MQNFRAYEKWQRKTSLFVYNTKSNAYVEPVNNEFGFWKKRWSKHECKHTQKCQMQNLNPWVHAYGQSEWKDQS